MSDSTYSHLVYIPYFPIFLKNIEKSHTIPLLFLLLLRICGM